MIQCRRTTCPATVQRRAALAGIAALLLSVAPTCRGQGREPAPLRIGGTGMALATMRQIGDAFAAVHPEVVVDVLPSLGTGGGLAAVAAGAIDLALSARPMTDADRAKRLQDFSYARTPIAFVTHPGVALQGITLTEVAQVFSGRILAWPNGMPVRVIRRDPSDADWTMLRTLSADMVEAVQIALQRPGLLTAATDQDNADALERLPGSFGAMSIGQLRAENRRVVPLILDGAPPTAEAVAEGRYGLVRTLHAVWHDGPNPDLLRFLAFLRSGQTAELLTRLGHIAHVGPDA